MRSQCFRKPKTVLEAVFIIHGIGVPHGILRSVFKRRQPYPRKKLFATDIAPRGSQSAKSK